MLRRLEQVRAVFRRWGAASATRYLVRRALHRMEQLTQRPDSWHAMVARREYFSRKGAKIGWPFLLSNAVIVGPYKLLQNKGLVALGSNVIVLTTDSRLLPYFGTWRFAPVQLKDDVGVGLNSIICPGVTIGSHTMIGACTVVDRDVPDLAVILGSPFRVAGNFKKRLRHRIEDIEQHPELYTETFPYFRFAMPFEDIPLRTKAWCRTDTGETMSNRVRDFVRGTIQDIWEAIQEPDAFRASEQGIDLMRKQGYAIGQHCYIARDATFDIRSSSISIGHHCSIGTHATLVTHDGFGANYTGRVRCEPIRILDGCSIGAGAVILPGVTIGPGSVVEPGSIVSTDVPPYTVVAGMPAKPVATIWDWLDQRKREMAEHPDQFIVESRLKPYPLPPPESIPPEDLPRIENGRTRVRSGA